MMTIELRKILQLTVFALLTSAVAAGCGGGVSAEEACSKCGKDSASIAACTKNVEKQREGFDLIGCGSEFQSLLDCTFDNSTCIEQRSSTPDGCEQARVDALSCVEAL